MPPVHLMLKPASAGCNLRCKYCFYADEAACRAEGMRGMMTRETAALAAEKALAHAAHSSSSAMPFVWNA